MAQNNGTESSNNVAPQKNASSAGKLVYVGVAVAVLTIIIMCFLLATQNPPTQLPEPTKATSPTTALAHPVASDPLETTYVLNTNTMKFHMQDCFSADQIKEGNRSSFTGTRDELLSMGYSPCKNCNP